MKQLSKEQMKRVMGGVAAGAWCSTTFQCSDGTKRTLTCENATAGCVGIDDIGSEGDGYGYCEENGGIIMSSCSFPLPE